MPLFLFVRFCFFVLAMHSFLAAATQDEILKKIKSGEIQLPSDIVGKAASLGGGSSITVIPEPKTAATVSNIPSTSPVVEPIASENSSGVDTTIDLDSAYKKLVDADMSSLGLRQFGFNIFTQTFGQAPSNLAPSDEYIIGIGDEVVVYTWGRENGQRSVLVDKDGFFNYPPLAPVRIAGLSFGEAKTVVKSSLETISGLQAKVSLGQLSSIRVMIMGDVTRPGSYMVTAGTSLINALFTCGGISNIGSLRQIKLERGGRPFKTLDLYNLLIHGTSQNDFQLISGDVLFVPVAEKKVGVGGYVKRPAVYEARPGNKVSDMLRFAGGLTAEADANRIVVERYRGNEKKIVLDFRMTSSTGAIVNDAVVEDGDLIKVFPLLSNEMNSVVVTGHVNSPGKYEHRKGISVKSILPATTYFKPEAFFEYAVVKRIFPPEYHYEFIPFALGAIYADDGADFPLEPRDTLFIFSRKELTDLAHIVVKGNVRKPGRLPYIKNMRVSDAVIAAGGYSEDTYFDEAHILKASSDGKKAEVLKANLRTISKDYNSSDNVVLSVNDQLIIFSRWNFEYKDSVAVFGEVKNPGRYPFANGMTVDDLVKQAGWYTAATFRLYVEVVRTVIEQDSIEKEKVYKLNFDKIPDSGVTFKLQPRDEVFIRNIIDYGKSITVKLNGLFVFPGVYRAEKGESISSIIGRAGGFRKEAFLPGLVFSRVRVRERQQKNLEKVSQSLEKQLEQMLADEGVAMSEQEKSYRNLLIKQRMTMLENLKSSVPLGRVIIDVTDYDKFKGSEYDIPVEDGDELSVAENLNTVSVLGEVYAPISVVYSKGSNTIGKCLKLAGGVNLNGDEDNIYLVRADGSVITPQTIGTFSVYSWQDVEPGATIVVPPKTPKKGFWAEFEAVTRVIYQLAVTTGVVVSVIK